MISKEVGQFSADLGVLKSFSRPRTSNDHLFLLKHSLKHSNIQPHTLKDLGPWSMLVLGVMDLWIGTTISKSTLGSSITPHLQSMMAHTKHSKVNVMRLCPAPLSASQSASTSLQWLLRHRMQCGSILQPTNHPWGDPRCPDVTLMYP
jgi:hypothetical protein